MEKIIQQINKASLKLLAALTPEETYEKIAVEAVNLVNGAEGKVILARQNNKLEVVYATVGDPSTMIVRKNMNTYRSFTRREAFVLHSTDIKQKDKKRGYNSIIFIPLFYKNKSFGVLIIKSKEFQQFTIKELEILKLFGSIASLTIRKTELLRESNRNLELKDKFIALAAHELRTPLTSMSGFIQLLYRKLAKKGSVEADWTESLLQESQRLQNLIEEILDINKINAGKLQYSFEEVQLHTVLSDAIEMLKRLYPTRDIKVVAITKKSHTVADKIKLQKAIFNILENAAKFSGENTKIDINLKEDGSYRIIEVQDFGKGIDKEDLPYVFEGFFKTKENHAEGMGLGLFFSKNVIEAHQGEIILSSEKNKGTKVTIKLPIVKI